MFGIPLLRSAFHSAWRSTESKAALISRNATCSGRSNSWWISASRRKAKIASIVDRPATNPDCCGLRVASSNGLILARSTWAKTLPGMESSVIGLYLLQSATGPLPLYNVTRIPSFQSAGMWPVLQTRVKRKCRAFATGVMAYFRSSAAIPSEPGARPFRSLVMALVTSGSDAARRLRLRHQFSSGRG